MARLKPCPFKTRSRRFNARQTTKMPRRISTQKLVVIAASVLAMAAAGHAQLEAPAPYHLARLRGVFVDAKGNPIADAAVTLDRGDKVVHATTTSQAGKFEIKHASGRYWLHLNKRGYSTVGRKVIVGEEMLMYLHSSTLYIIAGPGACSDDCSTIFTSKAKFDRALRRNTGRYD